MVQWEGARQRQYWHCSDTLHMTPLSPRAGRISIADDMARFPACFFCSRDANLPPTASLRLGVISLLDLCLLPLCPSFGVSVLALPLFFVSFFVLALPNLLATYLVPTYSLPTCPSWARAGRCGALLPAFTIFFSRHSCLVSCHNSFRFILFFS